MPKTSTGLLLHRLKDGVLEVFLVHPVGPFWAKKDDGAWSIQKGEFVRTEGPLGAAKRKFTEETSLTAPGDFVPLKPLKQPGGKVVHAWAVKGDADPARVRSNSFVLKGREYPEVDRAAWFGLAEARKKILRGQVGFLDQLQALNPELH